MAVATDLRDSRGQVGTVGINVGAEINELLASARSVVRFQYFSGQALSTNSDRKIEGGQSRNNTAWDRPNHASCL